MVSTVPPMCSAPLRPRAKAARRGLLPHSPSDAVEMGPVGVEAHREAVGVAAETGGVMRDSNPGPNDTG